MRMNRFLGGVMLSWVCLTLGGVHNASARSLLDGDVEAHEADRVELVYGSSGSLIQVRVEGCESCQTSGYLPARGIAISLSGEPLGEKQRRTVSGGSGTVVVSTETGMVRSVDFWAPRGEGAEQ